MICKKEPFRNQELEMKPDFQDELVVSFLIFVRHRLGSVSAIDAIDS